MSTVEMAVVTSPYRALISLASPLYGRHPYLVLSTVPRPHSRHTRSARVPLVCRANPSVTLVILFSDTLEALLPQYTSNQWKVFGLVVIIPTMFLPLHLLSYSSFLGILSTWALVVILIFTGIVTPTTPGSIRDPAPTDLWPAHGWVKFATVFGLMIGGVSLRDSGA